MVLSWPAWFASPLSQDVERSLCANLNSLAMLLLGRGTEGAGAEAGLGSSPPSAAGKGKAAAEEEDAVEGFPDSPVAKRPRRGSGKSAAASSEDLEEALHLLVQSFK